ncbi:MAG: AraC family transcriptional regulator [Pseudomonadota bacterium]
MQRIVFDAAGLAGDDAARKDEWIASLSSGYARLNADPVAGRPFRGELRIVLADDVSVGTVQGTVKTIARTAADIAVHNTDNLVLLCNAGAAPIRIEQRGRSADLATGAATMIRQCEPSWVRAGTDCRLLALQAPWSRVRARAASLDDHTMRPLAASSAALALMRAYAAVLLDDRRFRDAALARLVPAHLADLIAAAIDGGDGDAIAVDVTAARPGIAAARLGAIKADILAGLTSRTLSVGAIAARHGVTPRYVHRLFEQEGATFSEFVLANRLERAHAMLAAAGCDDRSIGAIAFACGFNDLSHFNRSFRRRFGTTPSAIRARGG